MAVPRHDEVRTASLCGLDELVVVRIIGNNPELAGNRDHIGRGPEEGHRVFRVGYREPKLGYENSAQFFEDRRRDDQVGQTGLDRENAAIRVPRQRSVDTRMFVSSTTRI